MRGVWTALVTPFKKEGSIDWSAYSELLENQRAAGVSGVIPCGTTGEAPTLTLDERRRLILTAVDTMNGSSTQVIAGTGSNSTQETVEFSRWASEQSVAGVLVVTPYYNKPSAAGLEAHYLAVADAVECALVLYNVPGRTGLSLSPGSIERLSQHPKIRALKEASGNLTLMGEVISQISEKSSFDVLSGDDGLFLPSLSIGAVGVVSVVSNLFPRGMLEIQRAFDRGDTTRAKQLHQKFHAIFRDLFIESNPGPIKSALAYAGWCENLLRAPLAPLSFAHQATLHSTLDWMGVKPGQRESL